VPQYEFTLAQQYFPALRSSWKPPYGPILDRYLDTSEVRSTVEIEWPDELARESLKMPSCPDPWGQRLHLSGRPVQVVNPDNMRTITERNTYQGTTRTMMMPQPVEPGGLWIEGMPNRGGGPWDRHWIGMAPDGRAWEAIGVEKDIFGRWGCLSMARYDAHGNIHSEDHPVTKAGLPLHSLLLQRGDVAHRLSITLTNYARGRYIGESDGSADWEFPRVRDWIALDPDRVDWPSLTDEQRALCDMLVIHGAIIGDRGGHNSISVIPGAQWKGSTLAALDLRLDDFLLVTA
jgi:hypothetical protein